MKLWKRAAACFLALTFALSQSTWVSAADGSTAGNAAAGNGRVNVEIGPALVLQKSVDFTVGLSGQQAQTITLAPDLQQQKSKTEVGFKNLANGDYTLTIDAPGFQTFTQQVTVKDSVSTIKVTTGFVDGLDYADNFPNPGVILIGDVNGDKQIDDADRRILTDAIDAGTYSAETDLNGDKKTDLADLEYLAKGYQIPPAYTAAQEEKSVPASYVKPSVGVGTEIRGDGSLEKLLEKEGTVVLAPPQELLRDENGDPVKDENGNDVMVDVPISDQNPVSLEFTIPEDNVEMDGIVIEADDGNPISKATVEVSFVNESGELVSEIHAIDSTVNYLTKEASQVTVTQDVHGNIQVHLGGQVAVKKVSLTIMGMQNNNNLAEISKVEFVNGMEERIPEPKMDIPEGLTANAGSKSISLSWDHCVNVTGYEVMIKQGDLEESYLTSGNTFQLTRFNNDDLVNYTEYTIAVQSLNGTWRSGFCAPVTATPKPSSRPDKPDNFSTTGGYKCITAQWKDMSKKDTQSYNLYYRKTDDPNAAYTKIEGLKINRYLIENLEDNIEYELYVTGVNEIGESDPSLHEKVKTTTANAANIPKYHLINTGEKGAHPDHITNVTHGVADNAWMADSPLDKDSETSAWGVVDKDPKSYYIKKNWDDGGFNGLSLGSCLTFEFDEVFKIDTIAFQQVYPGDTGMCYAKARYWDKDGKQHDIGSISIYRKTDAENRMYYMLKLPYPVEAKKFQFGIGRYLATAEHNQTGVNIADVYFYRYDTLQDEINALYSDDLHMVLKENVGIDEINALREKVKTVDPVSQEHNPEEALLLADLQTAEDILNNKNLDPPVAIHNTITTNDRDRGFGGLNAWQPAGVSAAAEEEIVVFVGHNSKRTGESTNLQLIATQYHAESSPMSKKVADLKIGKNTITIPKIWNKSQFESGGALYIQYTGNNTNDRYAVRISGGTRVPELDLYKVTDGAEKQKRAEEYITALDAYVNDMKATHEKVHAASKNGNINLAYDEANCILGATDILLDNMLLSIPAQQVLKGLEGSNTTEAKAKQLVSSMDAMEEMMHLFYQHKGLNNNATVKNQDNKDVASETDYYPKRHLNIRYQRMFSGAFMYASGDHIGIEYPETAGLMKAVPVQSEDGKYKSGGYFGWGIAHEIGHCINQGVYAVAEVTNNYFSVLAQAKETNESVRFSYENVYDKVTSGTKGSASNVFTQLGMYWQLHLAYDDGYNYKTYDDYQEQLDNLFFARVDTYARTPSRAPQAEANGVKLELTNSDKDQDLMRLCCAAAEKNILEFFERWGKTPDEGTIAYASQFEKENRAIYYVNDEARAYRVTHKTEGSQLNADGTTEAVGASTGAKVSAANSNQVVLTLSADKIPADSVLGYEIVRSTISGGQVEKEPVGFTTENTFTDTVTTLNHRVVTYEVTVVDKFLHRSAVKVLDPIKIEHDGSMDKTHFSISYSDILPMNQVEAGQGTDEDPCEPKPADPAAYALDNKPETAFEALVVSYSEIVLEFNKPLVVSGLKYTAGSGKTITDYIISVRNEDGEWTEAAKGSFDGSGIAYFANADGKYVSTYRTTAVKLAIPGQTGDTVSIAELDVVGPTGDNVDFRKAGDTGTTVIGKLSADFKYGQNAADVIPKDSIVFTGSYKGSPAYNVVLLYDQNGKIVGGADEKGNLKAAQVILAEVPDTGKIEDVSDGTWIYWIEPKDQAGLNGVEKVRAELYRVNDALTNEGQRLVSDSLFETMPKNLPDITFSGNIIPKNSTASAAHLQTGVDAGQTPRAIFAAAALPSDAWDVRLAGEKDRADLSVQLPEGTTAANTSLQLSLKAEQKAGTAKLQMAFAENLPAKIAEYRYHADTGILNVYLAGTTPLFAEQSLAVGTVIASSEDEKGATAEVSVDPASVKTVENRTSLVTKEIQSTAAATLIVGDGGPMMYGDMDADGSITSNDALIVLRIAAKLMTPSETDLRKGNVDNKEGVDAGDALCILQKAAKLIERFPVEEPQPVETEAQQPTEAEEPQAEVPET